MKGNKGLIQYRIHDTFLLRSPLLPLKVLNQISSTADIESILYMYLSRGECQEALYLASPGLYRKALGFVHQEEKDEKANRKLLQYLIRMASRCTPFGSFAGVSSGTFEDGSKVMLGGADEHYLYFRPDMQLLCQLSQQVQTEHAIREKLKYVRNTSLYRLADEYRYIEYFTNADGVRKYLLSSTKHNSMLEHIVEEASEYQGFTFFVDTLNKKGIEESEAREYIHTLIDNQVLVSDLEPSVSGKGFYPDLKDRIKDDFWGNAGLDLFNEISTGVDSLGRERSPSSLYIIDSLVDKTRESGFEFRENAFIQCDMKLATKACCLDNSIRDELSEVTKALLKMSRAQQNPLMERFKKSFIRRYGDTEVPLSLLMDAEAGPGYLPDDKLCGNDVLLDGLELSSKGQVTREMEWSEVDAFLFKKHQQAIIGGQYEVLIEDHELGLLPDPEQKLPASASLMVRILDKGGGSRPPTLYFNSAGGSSAMKLAGRFAYLDVDLQNCLREIANIEQKSHKEAILAEIIHLPEERTGNVLLRPVFYPYEIPFLAKPSLSHDYCLPIEDLYVKVNENKIWLRSRKLDRYILPRLSNAHNYSIGRLSLYRFLCDLQTEGYNTYFGFSWGPIEEDFIFQPRVVYKGHVLSAAQWNLPLPEIKHLQNPSDENNFKEGVSELRKKYHIPREIVLVEYDNELWLDLENRFCLKILRHELQKTNKLKIMEFLHPSKESLVGSEQGNHANEFLFFLYQDT